MKDPTKRRRIATELYKFGTLNGRLGSCRVERYIFHTAAGDFITRASSHCNFKGPPDEGPVELIVDGSDEVIDFGWPAWPLVFVEPDNYREGTTCRTDS